MVDFGHLFPSNYIHVKQSYRVQLGMLTIIDQHPSTSTADPVTNRQRRLAVRNDNNFH